MPTIQPREITENFRLERVLKSSRSAIVFRAVDPATGATVAIKLIPPASLATLPACQERFMAAMAVLASAAPATFPALLDHGFTPDGSAFMVMEFVEGERLDALIGAAPARILGLALEVAQGLAVLARAGAAHGNISPENIVSRRVDGVERVSILGFGTAAFHAGARAAGETAPPSGAGRFVAPERRGAATGADWRADLYALAATCCALLRAEVAGDDAPTVTLPQAVAQRIPEPTALAAALGQALRADPACEARVDRGVPPGDRNIAGGGRPTDGAGRRRSAISAFRRRRSHRGATRASGGRAETDRGPRHRRGHRTCACGADLPPARSRARAARVAAGPGRSRASGRKWDRSTAAPTPHGAAREPRGRRRRRCRASSRDRAAARPCGGSPGDHGHVRRPAAG